MIAGTSRIDWKVRYGDAEASHTISLTLPPLESYHGNNVLFEFEWPAAALPQDIQVALGGVELGDAKIRSDIVQDRATRFQLRVSLLREVAGALYGEKNLPQQVQIQFCQLACVANCFAGMRAAEFPVSITRAGMPVSLTFELPRSSLVVRAFAKVLAWLRQRSMAYELAPRCSRSTSGLEIRTADTGSGTVVASYEGTEPLCYPAIEILFRMPLNIALERGFGYIVTSIASFISGLLSGLVLYYLLKVR